MTLEELYRLLRSSHVQSQGIVDTLQEPLVVLDRHFCVVTANPAFLKTFHAERDVVLGSNFFELGNGQWNIADLRNMFADVVPKSAAVIGYRVDHDFADIGRRVILVTARKLHHPDENSTQMLVVFEDITKRQKADTAKDILLAETRHRMKNLIAVLRAVASQTETDGRSAEEYRDAFIGRFEAVMGAQTLITEPGARADLATLVDQTIRPVAGSRADVAAGAPVVLAEHQILPMSMMLHELATNALKYGALSSSSGLVHIDWTTEVREGEHYVLLNWNEEGGPSVAPPERRGFGMRLIEHSAKAEDGEVVFNFDAAGLRAKIALPVPHPETG